MSGHQQSSQVPLPKASPLETLSDPLSSQLPGQLPRPQVAQASAYHQNSYQVLQPKTSALQTTVRRLPGRFPNQVPGQPHGRQVTQVWSYDQKTRQQTSAESPTTLTLQPRLHKRELGNKPASKFDNFYTPQNDFFYSKSPYLSLDPTRREIRLLRVFPPSTYSEHINAHPQWAPMNGLGQYLQADQQTVSTFLRQNPKIHIDDTQTRLIACELLDKVPLVRVDGQFCALSYCAGSPEITSPILVDGIPVNLFANLEHAISCAYTSWTSRHPGKELLLWVDQVAINQENHKERSSQVSMMQDIYRRSCESFVCLSTPGNENCLDWALSKSDDNVWERVRTPSEIESSLKKECFAEMKLLDSLRPGFLSKIYDSPELAENLRAGGSRDQLDSLEILKQRRGGKRAQRYAFAGYPNQTAVPQLSDLTYQNTTVASIEQFMGSHWWRRAWVYQEFICSPHPIMLSGSDCMTWAELSPLVQFVCSDLDMILASVIPVLYGVSLQEKLNASLQLKTMEKRQKEYWNQLDKYAALDNEGFHKWKQDQYDLWSFKKVEFLQKAVAEVKYLKNLETKPSAYFSHKKENARVPELSEEIATFQHELKTARFELLYRGECYKNPMERSRLHPRGLKLVETQIKELAEVTLDFVGAREHGFWSTETGKTLNDMWKEHNLANVPIHYEPYTITKFNQEVVLRRKKYLAGVQQRLRTFVPVISSVTERKRSNKRSLDLKVHLQHSRNCDASDPRDRIFAFVGLGHKGYAITPNYSTEYTIAHASMDAARKIIEHELSLDILTFVHRGRGNLGYLLPTWMPDWTSREDTQTVLDYTQALDNPKDVLSSIDAAKGLRFSAKFRYDRGNDANVDLRVKGLIVGVLHDMEQSIKGFPDLKFFLTLTRWRVVVPKSALPDDEIWVLHGSRWPVLLRPEGNDAYGFLGLAMIFERDDSISNIMFGTLGEGTNNGETGSVDIWLV